MDKKVTRRPFLQLARCGALFGVALGCATGVSISDDELQALLDEQDTAGAPAARGAMQTGAGGASLSGAGGRGSGTSLGGASTSGIGGGTTSGASANNCAALTGAAECLQGPVSVTYTDRSQGDVNQITFNLSVRTSGAAFDLSDLVLRYWYRADGEGSLVADLDYVGGGPLGDIKQQTRVCFGQSNGVDFAEITFDATTMVSEVQQVQVRLHTQNYARVDQSNDPSFLIDANSSANENISVYLGGVQVAGCEP